MIEFVARAYHLLDFAAEYSCYDRLVSEYRLWEESVAVEKGWSILAYGNANSTHQLTSFVACLRHELWHDSSKFRRMSYNLDARAE